MMMSNHRNCPVILSHRRRILMLWLEYGGGGRSFAALRMTPKRGLCVSVDTLMILTEVGFNLTDILIE